MGRIPVHTGGVADDAAIPADEVKAELERILASKGFSNAGRLSRLLRHVVEKTLAGETEQLKEYSVGVEVFDRDDKYDPRLDSIVRVEAGRLRTKLDEYYAGEGAQNQVRIALPRGAYAARFAESRPAEPVKKWNPALAGLGVLAIATVAVWLYGSRSIATGPSIAVLAFDQYASATGEDDTIAAQLTDGVTAELARIGTLSVVSHTSAMQFAGQRRPVREIAAALNADVILEGSIEDDPAGIRVSIRAVNARTDRKMWVEAFPGRADALPDLNRRIAAAVTAAVVERMKGDR